MKNFMLFIVGILCTIAYFKWDAIKTFAEDFIAEYNSSDGRFEISDCIDDGTIDDEKRFQLASEWQNGEKRRCVERLNAMKKVFDSKTSCPAYHCASSVTKAAKSAIINFERAIGRDDYVKAKCYDNAATDAMRRFEMNCRWKPGVSRGDGTHSGHIEGTWEPDPGRVIINGTAMREMRCGNCSGRGTVRSEEYCSYCNGRGRVTNPAAQVSDAVNMGVGFASMFGGGRAPRIQAPRVAQEINCSSCNGRGLVQVTHSCSQCNGSGKIYEP